MSSKEAVAAPLDIGLLVERLRAGLKGRVISPIDADYDAARTVFYGGFDRRPAAIVRAADAEDVRRVVSVTSETGAELAVRSGGHSLAGFSTSEGGVVLDVVDMNSIDIDPSTRTAWAETGLTAADYTSAAAAHDLATGFGDAGSVGIGGITLGGGIGFLVRKHGLTIDSLEAAEVVTADGTLVRADAYSHPDLFWAIRGGGGNFGVATRLKFRLNEVGTIYGGLLILPATSEVIASFLSEAEAAREELSTIANVMPAPPMPFVPPEHHGKLVIVGMLVYAGDPEVGERAVAPFRSLATPLVDMLKAMPYPQMYLPEPEGFHPISSSRTMFVDSFDSRSADTILERLDGSNALMAATQVRVLGGAMARVPAQDTAFAHRDRKMMVNVAAMYERPEEAAEHEPWVDGLAAALRDRPGAYVNFLEERGDGRVNEAYPGPTWDRLRAIKRHYDPENLFRLNHNIPPA